MISKGFFKTMQKLHPEHWLFSAGLDEQKGMVTYQEGIESEALMAVGAMCRAYIDPSKVFEYASFEEGRNDTP